MEMPTAPAVLFHPLSISGDAFTCNVSSPFNVVESTAVRLPLVVGGKKSSTVKMVGIVSPPSSTGPVDVDVDVDTTVVVVDVTIPSPSAAAVADGVDAVDSTIGSKASVAIVVGVVVKFSMAVIVGSLVTSEVL